MIYLKDADIPQYYKDITNVKCEYCNSDIITNENLTIVKCSNPNCPRKIAGSINKITTMLGLKNIGESTALAYVKSNNYTKITDFLSRPPLDVASEVKAGMARIGSLAEAVKFLCINDIKEKMGAVVEPYATAHEFFEAIEDDEDYYWGVFGRVLGFKEDYSNMINLLADYAEDFFEIDTLFPQLALDRESSKDDIVCNICISEHINSSIMINYCGYNPSKEQFIPLINEMFKGKGIKFVKKSTVTQDTNFVITDGQGTTSKANEGRRRGILFKSDEFIANMLNALNDNKDKG